MAESVFAKTEQRDGNFSKFLQRKVSLQDNRGTAQVGKLIDNRTVQLAKKPNNTGLPDNLKSGIEHLSGMSMDHVRVHYNSSQPAQLNALAYAQGSNIHVAPGQEKHLPHEAWHVVQQAQGRVKPTMQAKGVAINDNQGLEREADTHYSNRHDDHRKNVMQLKAGDVIQLVTFGQLSPEDKGIVEGNSFWNFCAGKGYVVKKDKITAKKKFVNPDGGVDIPQMQTWLAEFKSQQASQPPVHAEEEKAFAGGGHSMAERLLPQPVESHGNKISFKTNIQSGVNGMFDLWYFRRLGILDVDVKMKIDDPRLVGQLQQIEAYWSQGVTFVNIHDHRAISLHINVQPVVAGAHHFQYVDVTGSEANPQVLRSNQQFSARRIGAKEDQTSAYHEFGHVLGLGEEYDDSYKDRSMTHHLNVLDEYNPELGKPAKQASAEGGIAQSIMGKANAPVPHARHYLMVLKEFCILTGDSIKNWAIQVR